MNRVRYSLLGISLLVLVTQLPIFLQMTLTPDTVLYDMQAQCFLEGGVLYRDIVEPNLPGVVWVHATLRSIVGWSTPAIRIFDVAVLLGIALTLGRLVAACVRCSDQQRFAKALVLVGTLLFYLGTSEWCHCQRDTWMLLPCLLALTIRYRLCSCFTNGENGDLAENSTLVNATAFASCFVEGILWAIGFWLKPFVAFPAIAVLIASTNLLPGRKTAIVQISFVLLGGALTGLMGIGWMHRDGSWPHFLTMLTEWNGDYFKSGRSRWTLDRFAAHADRFLPWVLLHIPAVSISLKTLWPRWAGRKQNPQPHANLASRGVMPQILLAAMYLGWIMQAFLLQQLFDYVHVPGIILAIGVCVQSFVVSLELSPVQTGSVGESATGLLRLKTFAVFAFIAIAMIKSPTLQWDRQRHGLACVQACLGASLEPSIKDAINLGPFPRWTELQPLMERIRELQISNRSLIAYNGNLIHLYPALSFQSPTRFVYIDVLARCFPQRRQEILDGISTSKARYVVCDLIEDGWNGDVEHGLLLPGPILQHAEEMFFPYSQKPIFRSGRYVLFEIDGPLGYLTSDYLPLSNAAFSGLPRAMMSQASNP